MRSGIVNLIFNFFGMKKYFVLFIVVISSLSLISCGVSKKMSSNDNIPASVEEVLAVTPPDPGEAGKATLAGIDSDNDGVRDDVELKLIEEFEDDREVLETAIQVSKKLGSMEEKNIDSYINYITSLSGSKVLNEMSKVTKHHLNTKERKKAYGQALAGRVGE